MPNLFSIVIPTYNRAYCLRTAIESVLNQRYSDFEVIVVDDCSTDETEALISSVQSDKLIYSKMAKNLGNAVARNKGVDLAKGDFICFLDSDDTLEPDFLSNLNSNVLEFPQTSFFWTGINLIQDGVKVGTRVWNPKFETPSLDFFRDLKIGTNYGLSVNRAVFDSVGLFDENLKASVDRDFLLRLSQIYNGRSIDLLLVNYTLSSKGSVRKDLKNQALAYMYLTTKYQTIIDSNQGFQKYWYHKAMWLCYYSEKKKEARRFFRKGKPSLRTLILFLLFELFPTHVAVKVHKMLGSKGFTT